MPKIDELKNELSRIAADYINAGDDRDDAVEAFQADVLECLKKYRVEGYEAEEILDSVEVRVLDYGDSPDNASFFSTAVPPDEIFEMISDTFLGDYGDEVNDAIDTFLNDLKENVSQLNEDVCFDDPVSGVITVATLNAGETLELNGAYWPEVDDSRIKPGE